ncbi:MAG: hypothetical protein ACM3U1_05985 [Chloroflexota bacterium]
MKKFIIALALIRLFSIDAYSMQLYYLRPIGGDINLHVGYPFYSTQIAENHFLKSLNIQDDNLNIHTKESYSSKPYYQLEGICRLNWYNFTGLGLKGNYTYSTTSIEGTKITKNGVEYYKASQFISCEQYGTFVEFTPIKWKNNPFLYLLGGIGYQHSYRLFKETYSPDTQIERKRQESVVYDCIYLEPGARVYWWTSIYLSLAANLSYNVGLGSSAKMSWNGLRTGLELNILLFDRVEDHSYDDCIEE